MRGSEFMAKYCTFCGKQLTDKASFCVHCGNKVVNNTKTPKNKILIFFKNTKFISRILVVLFVILILVFLSTDFDYSNTGLPGSLLLILVPAAIIEYNKNPALSQFKEKNKKRKAEKTKIEAERKEIEKIQRDKVLIEKERERIRQKQQKRADKEIAKKMRAYKGVYLTIGQIENLENEIELPIVDTPVFLHAGEKAVYYSEATKQENHRNNTTLYKGKLVLTNHRIIFLNDQKGFEIKLSNLTTSTEYLDAFSFQSGNRVYTLLIPCPSLFGKAFKIILDKNQSYEDSAFNNLSLDIDELVFEDETNTFDYMEGHDFEYFCADLIKYNGFYNVSVTKGSGDQGVDILAEKDGIKYAIQCKNYSSHLGNTPIQEVNAGKTFYNCHVGVVMTNSSFTPGAKDLAKATGVILWDRIILEKMIESKNKSS